MMYRPDTHSTIPFPDASGNTTASNLHFSVPQRTSGRREMPGRRLGAILPWAVVFASLPLLALAEGGPRQAPTNPPAKHAQTAAPDRGQQVFEQNCSRCHNAPEGFSPHISGTIAMHMRVRANLSEADYRELRRFLNP
jgi:hypothetical protein